MATTPVAERDEPRDAHRVATLCADRRVHEPSYVRGARDQPFAYLADVIPRVQDHPKLPLAGGSGVTPVEVQGEPMGFSTLAAAMSARLANT